MQLSGHDLFMLCFWLMVSYLVWMPPTWFLLTFLLPRSLVDRYFCAPHFNQGELTVLSAFPGSVMRTGIFAWLVAFPSLDRRRGMRDIRNYTPRWFVNVARCFCVVAAGQGFVAIVLLVCLALWPGD